MFSPIYFLVAISAYFSRTNIVLELFSRATTDNNLPYPITSAKPKSQKAVAQAYESRSERNKPEQNKQDIKENAEVRRALSKILVSCFPRRRLDVEPSDNIIDIMPPHMYQYYLSDAPLQISLPFFSLLCNNRESAESSYK